MNFHSGKTDLFTSDKQTATINFNNHKIPFNVS